jgi:hypothetical protein
VADPAVAAERQGQGADHDERHHQIDNDVSQQGHDADFPSIVQSSDRVAAVPAR